MQFTQGHRPHCTRIGKRALKGCYIVAYTNKRKNGKRHVLARYNDLEAAEVHYRQVLKSPLAKHATINIYTSIWEVIK